MLVGCKNNEQLDNQADFDSIETDSRFVYLSSGSDMPLGSSRVIVDRETGVEYLFVVSGYGRCMTPLFNADGSLVTIDKVD